MAFSFIGAAASVIAVTGNLLAAEQSLSCFRAFTADGKGKATLLLMMLLMMSMVNGNDDHDVEDDQYKLGFRFLRDEAGYTGDWIVYMAAPQEFYRNLRANATAGGVKDDCSFGPLWDNEGKWPEHLIKVRYPSSTIKDDESALTFRFELPSLDKKNIKATVKNYELRVINRQLEESETDEDNAGLMMSLLVWPCWFDSSKIKVDVKPWGLTVVAPLANGKCFLDNYRWWSSFWALAQPTIDKMNQVLRTKSDL